MSQTPNATTIPAGTRPVLVYDGDIGDLFGVFLMNMILTIITFGIFRFWAITRIRRYLWSHMRFEDTRFTYTGKGRELFLGFLLAMLILMLAIGGGIAISVALMKPYPVLAGLLIAAVYIGMFILFGAAHFSAQRYRLSRTEWRGIRGGMRGSALRYGLSWLLYLLLTVVTLYQAVPWMQVGLARRRINATRFGSAVFLCEGRARHLYLSWLATIVGVILLGCSIAAIVVALDWTSFAQAFSGKADKTAVGTEIGRAVPAIILGVLVFFVVSGLLTTWYYVRLIRLILNNTTAVVPGPHGQDAIRFSTTATAGGLLWLVGSNVLIVLLTFGFGLPVLLHRTARYIARTTVMTGTFDAAHLIQSTLARPSLGEGFLQAMDPGIV